MKLIYIFLGLFLILLGLWGGAYLLHIFSKDGDFGFASFTTGIIIALLGIIMVGLGIAKSIEP